MRLAALTRRRYVCVWDSTSGNHEQNDAVQRVKTVDAAEEFLDRGRLFAGVNILSSGPHRSSLSRSRAAIMRWSTWIVKDALEALKG